MTNASSKCLWSCLKNQSDVVRKMLIFVIIWIDSQNESACHISWQSYRWGWVGLEWLHDECVRFLFYHFQRTLDEVLWLTIPANHARCGIHCLPGTTNNWDSFNLCYRRWCLSFLTAPNWRKKQAHTGASSKYCIHVLPFQFRFSAVKKY